MNPASVAANLSVHYNSSRPMSRIVRITALLLTAALLATPLGATVCAGHCAQPQAIAASPASHCGGAMAEDNPSFKDDSGAPRLTSANPCGVKSVPTILKVGDDRPHLQPAHAAPTVYVTHAHSYVVLRPAPTDSSPPGIYAPHLTPLRI